MRLKLIAAVCVLAVSGVAHAGDNWAIDKTPNHQLDLVIGSFANGLSLANAVVTFDFFVSNSGSYNLPDSVSLSLIPGGSIVPTYVSTTGGAHLLDDPESTAGSFYHYTAAFSNLTAGGYSVKVYGDDGLHKIAVTNFNATVSAVPEPETYAMMLAGLGAVGFMARRRKVQ